MSHNFAYVLTTDEKMDGAMATYVSVLSLRHFNRSAKIHLFLDEATRQAIQKAMPVLLSAVDDVVVVQCPAHYSTVQRSRFIRVSLRSLINGKFVYLDGDTIIRGDLSEMFLLDKPVAACINHNADRFSEQIPANHLAIMRDMGWGMPRNFYNSGVIYFNDGIESYLFAQCWSRLWRSQVANGLSHYDQPSFNACLNFFGFDNFILDHRYNLQVWMFNAPIEKSLVWHYYSSLKNNEHLVASPFYDFSLMEIGSVDFHRHLHSVLSTKLPLRSENLVEYCIARYAMKRGFLSKSALKAYRIYLKIKGHAYS